MLSELTDATTTIVCDFLVPQDVAALRKLKAFRAAAPSRWKVAVSCKSHLQVESEALQVAEKWAQDWSEECRSVWQPQFRWLASCAPLQSLTIADTSPRVWAVVHCVEKLEESEEKKIRIPEDIADVLSILAEVQQSGLCLGSFLDELDVGQYPCLTEVGLAALSVCSNLRKLTLRVDGHLVNHDICADLRFLKRLEDLTLFVWHHSDEEKVVTHDGLCILATLPLRRLEIEQGFFDNDPLLPFSNCATLEHVHFGEIDAELSDEGLMAVVRGCNLRSLELCFGHCGWAGAWDWPRGMRSGLTESGFRSLGEAELERLEIMGPPPELPPLDLLGEVLGANLTHLRLDHCDDHLTEQGLQRILSRCPRVETLYIYDLFIKDVQILLNCQAIRELDVACFCDHDVAAVATGLPRLEILSLADPDITDASLRHLASATARFNRFRRLSIRGQQGDVQFSAAARATNFGFIIDMEDYDRSNLDARPVESVES